MCKGGAGALHPREVRVPRVGAAHVPRRRRAAVGGAARRQQRAAAQPAAGVCGGRGPSCAAALLGMNTHYTLLP